MKPKDVSLFIRNEYARLSKAEIIGLWAGPALGILANISLFLPRHFLPDNTIVTVSRIISYVLLFLLLVFLTWSVKLIRGSIRTNTVVRTRYLYGGHSFYLGAISFLLIGVKLLLIYGETQDIVRGILLVIIASIGSIALGITTINGRIYSLSNTHKKKMIPATLATVIFASSGILGMNSARVIFSSIQLEATEEPLIFLAIMTILFFVLSYIATMCYYRVYLLYKFELQDMMIS